MSDLISRRCVIGLIRSMYPSQPILPSNRRKWEEKYEPFIRFEREISKLPSAQPEFDKQELVRTITAGIVATGTRDIYSCGMRNGMRWCRALLEEDAPKFEDASLYAQLERTPVSEWQKDFREYIGMLNIPRDDYNGIMQYINEVPTAQTEPIRCKDCKHWDTSWQNDYAPNYHYCPLIDGARRDDFYCADAERRIDV